ncbi:hypothetical protein ACFQZQ_00345 [Lysobacter koreensis]|uniref:Uncharacterized protein n=1 Tax=Lysobacter koreensis TaxID=266122 RepID=A0ABW2YIP3_9GAMM
MATTWKRGLSLTIPGCAAPFGLRLPWLWPVFRRSTLADEKPETIPGAAHPPLTESPMKCPLALFVALLALHGPQARALQDSAGLGDAQPTADTLRQTANAVDCAAMAAMPGAPMTREACEAQKSSMLGLSQTMQASGAGARPGDDAMTCDQIVAEMQTMQVAGVSADNAAEAQAAGRQLKATQERAQAAGAAMMARQTLETAAAAVGPNAVQGVVSARQTAEQIAAGQRNKAAMQDATSRTTLAVAAATGDVAAAMQANPRWGRLIALSAARCAGYTPADGGQDW